MSRHFLLQAFLRLQHEAGLFILIFHRVLERADPLRPGEPTVQEFEARMRWVKSNFTVLPLREAVQRMREARLPRNALSITFDDGYADNRELAAPVLAGLGLHATFFVASGYLDGGRMFNDSVIEAVRAAGGEHLDVSDLGLGRHSLRSDEERRAAIASILDAVKYLPPTARDERAAALSDRVGAGPPAGLMMTSAQVAELHSMGMGIGAHTKTHPILQSIEEDAARDEIAAGRRRLEEIVQEPVRLFAYPNGRPERDYGPQHVRIAREMGFEAAVSTAWGVARPGADLHQLPRFTPWDKGDWRFGMRMLKTLMAQEYPRA